MSVSLSDIDRVYLNNKAMATIVKSISNPPLTLWATFVPCLFYHHVSRLILNCRVKLKRKRKRGVDYNAEIPFEKKPAPGMRDQICATLYVSCINVFLICVGFPNNNLWDSWMILTIFFMLMAGNITNLVTSGCCSLVSSPCWGSQSWCSESI